MTPVAAQISLASIQGKEVAEHGAPKARYWFFPKVVGILSAIYLMAGWSPGLVALMLLSLYLMVLSGIARTRHRDEGLSAPAYLFVLAASCSVTTTAALWLGFGENSDPTNVILALLMGFVIADVIDAGEIDARSRRLRDTLRHAIDTPVLFDRTGQGDLRQFEPHWAFSGRDDLSVWAIDPAQRTIRVLRAVPDGSDHVLRWDVPIRAVELRRVSSRLLGERDLYVLSGHDRAAEWSHVFQFSSGDKELALKWRDTFEAWMHEDQRRAVA